MISTQHGDHESPILTPNNEQASVLNEMLLKSFYEVQYQSEFVDLSVITPTMAFII